MKLIYVAGPFRSINPNGKSNSWGVQSNIMRAMAALCPHANTMFFQDADGCADEVWLEGDLEMLKRCDAVLMTPDWAKSSGARKEAAYAMELGIPVLYSIEEVKQWLSQV